MDLWVQAVGVVIGVLLLFGIGCVFRRGYAELHDLYSPEVQEAFRLVRARREVRLEATSGETGESSRSGTVTGVIRVAVGTAKSRRCSRKGCSVRAHRGQKDKGGAPYILHPLRVMLSLREPLEMVAAVLHDVVEDGGLSAEQIGGKGFAQEVVRALDALTRRPGEDYGEYLCRVKANPLALRAKVADLRDNLDESRIPDPTEEDLRRWEKYRRALHELEC